ncbi:MAG: hypothetical protein VB074_00690 [Proteiniphilum sp.]|uniref:hypothetical protein n=1 Tax=Proteiniphilum sp. TaxID=1926877 RepID=UPI000927151A|nr:hypothetical protein [Proteiniphilum sp.]MEA5126678.1 hypothetical protein [Proteiniphilum sp.]OJV88555.1 MAG: hypothetical protein BGO34_18195 [Bacteroidia bacterium 44-10]
MESKINRKVEILTISGLKSSMIILFTIVCITTFAMPNLSGEKDEPMPTANLTNPIFINFGMDTSATEWNHLTNYTKLTTLHNLIDREGNTTNISLVYVEKFNTGRHILGAKATTTDFDMPESVSTQELHGNSEGTGKAVLRFEGLDSEKKYDICFFGSRMGTGVKDNRETKYIVSGQNEVIALLNVSNNTSKTSCANGVQPDANGKITITIMAGENNNHPKGYYGVSAMRLSFSK